MQLKKLSLLHKRVLHAREPCTHSIFEYMEPREPCTQSTFMSVPVNWENGTSW